MDYGAVGHFERGPNSEGLFNLAHQFQKRRISNYFICQIRLFCIFSSKIGKRHYVSSNPVTYISYFLIKCNYCSNFSSSGGKMWRYLSCDMCFTSMLVNNYSNSNHVGWLAGSSDTILIADNLWRLGPLKWFIPATFYWSACTKPGKRVVMYLCDRSSDGNRSQFQDRWSLYQHRPMIDHRW